MAGLKRLLLGVALFWAYIAAAVTTYGPGGEILVVALFIAAVTLMVWGAIVARRWNKQSDKMWAEASARFAAERRAAAPPPPRPDPKASSVGGGASGSGQASGSGAQGRPQGDRPRPDSTPPPPPFTPPPSREVEEAAILLGVSPNDSADRIQSVYRRWAKSLHPDRSPNPEDATWQLQRINRARDILLAHARGRSARTGRGSP